MAVNISHALRFRALGRPMVEGPDGPAKGAAAQRKPIALLALLAAAGPRGMSRDKVLAYLWPETTQDLATHRLTQVLYSLRRDLGTDRLFLGTSDLTLNSSAISSDVTDFCLALTAGLPDRAAAVYNGPFLDGFFLSGAAEFDRWVEEQRAELAGRFRTVLAELDERAAAEGDYVTAAHWSGRLAQSDPLNARVAIRHMEALARVGNRAGALQFARAHEARLREELDATPDPAVKAAADRLRAQVAAESSVAVLPFINMSPERENDYFSDGMTEELTNALANVPGLRVASRLSAFAYKGKDSDIASVGASLGVRSVVEGSVRKVGNRIRITAQLIDTATGYHLWSHTYERTLADIFALQEEISQAIVRALPLKAGPGIPALISRANIPPLEAYTLYLRGRYFALKRTCESLRTAVEYFEQAIELDPGYALAYSGIAECYALLGFEEFGDRPPNEVMPRAKAAVERALLLDGELAEGHSWRGVLAFLYEYDWTRAEAAYQRAIEIKPTYSLAHTWYAVFLSAMGRHDEALARIHHAEQLDPMAITIQAVVGLTYYTARRFDEALHHYLATLEMDPDNIRVHAWVARLHYATGRFEKGLKALSAAMQRVGRPPILLVQEGRFLARLGRRQEALDVIRELESLADRQYVSVLASAAVHGALGDRQKWLDRYNDALKQRLGVLPFLAVEPGLDALRGEPRFQTLLRTMNLVPHRLAPVAGAPLM